MPGQNVEGVELEDTGRTAQDPQTQDNPDDGPHMTGAGAGPGGNAMDHWNTASPNTDATKPETMPKALGGTGETPNPRTKSNPA
jgi:hypothetical protein